MPPSLRHINNIPPICKWQSSCHGSYVAAEGVLHPHDFGVVTAFNENPKGKVEAYRLTYVDNNGPDPFYDFPAAELRKKTGGRFHSIPQDVAYQIATEGIEGGDGDRCSVGTQLPVCSVCINMRSTRHNQQQAFLSKSLSILVAFLGDGRV